MGLHKLTAGDGYTYLTRQVAAHDTTERGHSGLGDYYSEKGESPGRWWGAGLAAIGVEVGSEVTEQHMRNLFGEGRHPDAQVLEEAALDAGASVLEVKKASQLGRLFGVYKGNAPEFMQELARRFTDYNFTHGVHWRTPVPAEVRARIRTELTDEFFAREHGRAPLDDRERSGFLAQATRQQTKAVAGYDLTFTPVKSVSTLWAVADHEVAQEVEEAHHAAVEQTLAWLEKEVLFTRRGRGGVQQVKAIGLLAAVFTHRDSRSSDPHLHTHVAISNKVQDAQGHWLAVDGRVLYKANVTLSETYNSLLEAELVARLGVRFKARKNGTVGGKVGGRAKRPVREIEGIDPRLAAVWSSRNRAIEARRRELAAAFQASHGRPPTAGESVGLTKQAWAETRQAKHEPRAEVDQRAAWHREAVTILGSDRAVTAMVSKSLGHRRKTRNITTKWVRKTAAKVVLIVQEDRATWQVWHLRAEAERAARRARVRAVDLETAVDQVVATAIAEHCIGFDEPDPLTDAGRAAGLGVTIPATLTRADGASVYSLHGARLYTSRAIVEAEQAILAAARRTGGRRISEVRVGIAVAETAANGVTLNAAQHGLVREMATSGRRVQLGLAPAGTGKTTAMQVLTRAWQDAGGTVLGLAPSAVGAEQLGSSINPTSSHGVPSTASEARGQVRSDTLDKLVWHVRNGGAPEWMEAIDASTLVLIDEAGMASTTDLAVAIDYITSRGASVRLIGDDHQLASVAAGGVLRDIAHEVGAVTLTEVRRFLRPDGSLNIAEAGATLALRDGDPAALGYYADQGRIHVGDLGSCADQAYAAWAADRAQGIDSVLLAPTRELVAELNTRARNDRLAQHTTTGTTGTARAAGVAVGRVLTLADGTQVSAGDKVISRLNERRLPLSPTDWVKNGHRWTVTQVHDDGALTVTHATLRTSIRLPAAYVADNVQLGYATTVHGAQGITTGTCHVVLSGEEDRNVLYVALSRGQYANHLYLATSGDGDPHNLIRPEVLIPPTALDQLAQILRRDGSPVSATTAIRDLKSPATLLRDAAARYHDALTFSAEQVLGTPTLERLDRYAATLLNEPLTRDRAGHADNASSAGDPAGCRAGSVAEAAAWPTLRSRLALLALEGHDPFHLLGEAVHLGALAEARDPAAVLDARLETVLETEPPTGLDDRADDRDEDGVGARVFGHTEVGPLPWLPGIPARLAHDLDWGPYLTARHEQTLDRAATLTDHAQDWSSATAPAWAQPFLEDADTGLRTRLAVWRAVAEVPDSDLRPTGLRTIGTPGDHQAALERAVRQARPSYPFAQRGWYQALPDSVRLDPWITPLCQRLARLERAGLPVETYLAQALGPHHDADPDTALDPAPDSAAPAQVARPLPDEYQAAALWWRLVPHLGPAAMDGDAHTADLLHPTWLPDLTGLVGASRAEYLQQTPAWPALVAAVDQACNQKNGWQGWTAETILDAGLAGIPDDGSLTGVEVADALVLRIAMLTDPPADLPTGWDEGAEGAGRAGWESSQEPEYEPDREPPADLDDFLTDIYRANPDQAGPTYDASDPHGGFDLDDAYVAQVPWEPPPFDPYVPRLPWEDDPERNDFDDDLGSAFPDPDEIPAQRIVELNQLALDYYQACYPRSWAPGYLRERLGTDLRDDRRFTVGYAPPGPRSLLRHLTGLGASIDELEQAGLIRLRERRNGSSEYVDAFRDRLIMPIHANPATSPAGHREHDAAREPTGAPAGPAASAVIGFLGRRNPTKTDENYAGPKYLNTKNTPVFTKGQALFGYAETFDLLAAGALPVLVEGPMDAYAITLASAGTAVGLAPMGTALTVEQIKLLLPHIDRVDHRDQIAVATDADGPGWKAAQADFWNLTAADLDPAHVALPDGLDPAQLLQTEGADAVRAALADRVPLGEAMIEELLRNGGTWSDPDVRQAIVHGGAQILAARGPEAWAETTLRLRGRLHLSPGLLEHQTVTESIERGRDRFGYSQRRIATLQEQERNRHTSSRHHEARDAQVAPIVAPTVAQPHEGLEDRENNQPRRPR